MAGDELSRLSRFGTSVPWPHVPQLPRTTIYLVSKMSLQPCLRAQDLAAVLNMLFRPEYEKGIRADLEARSIRMAAREKHIADDEAEAHAQWSLSATNAAKQVEIRSEEVVILYQ